MTQTILLLFASNIFMTYAWYGHLKDLQGRHIAFAILISWGIAFFEYCLQVPANRIGAGHFSLAQLKIIQEILDVTTEDEARMILGGTAQRVFRLD